jgi:hypothetical protein
MEPCAALRVPRFPTPVLLPAPHKLHNFQLSAGPQRRLRPVRLLDDAAVQFHRNPRRVQFQLPQKTQNGLPFRRRFCLAVYDDLDHAWLTPLFSTHYSQI